jgi:hypothetical protein
LFSNLKSIRFSSVEEMVTIPLGNLLNGNYYLNIVAEQNYVLDRKTIPAY